MILTVEVGESHLAHDDSLCEWLDGIGVKPDQTYKVIIDLTLKTVEAFRFAVNEAGAKYAACTICGKPVAGEYKTEHQEKKGHEAVVDAARMKPAVFPYSGDPPQIILDEANRIARLEENK